LIQTVNISLVQNGTYVLSAYIELYNISGPVIPGDPSTGCNITFGIGYETTTPPEITYYGPAQTSFTMLQSEVPVNIPLWGIEQISSEGFGPLSDWDPTFGVGMQCGVGVTGIFIIDQLSMCLASGGCT
jgi:hypothetical protein